MKELVERLAREFADADYAHAYMEEHGNMFLAAQIKAIREMRGMTQEKLAELSGMKQERVSALENVEYDSWTVKTLRKLANAFDTGLQVSFVPCSQIIMEVANVSPEKLQIEDRMSDLEKFHKRRIIGSEGNWKAVARDHLATISVLAPTQPIDPTKVTRWRGLDGYPSGSQAAR